MNHDSSSKINKRMKSDPKENRKDIYTIKKKGQKKNSITHEQIQELAF